MWAGVVCGELFYAVNCFRLFMHFFFFVYLVYLVVDYVLFLAVGVRLSCLKCVLLLCAGNCFMGLLL